MTNPALHRALSALPQYKKLQTALSAVEAAKAAHIAAKPVTRNGSDVIASIVETGEVDLLAIDALSATAAELQRYAAVEGFLFSASQSIKSEQESLMKRNATRLLAHLTEQLDEIVAEAGVIAPKLVGVESADDAIARNVASEWREALQLVERYKQIRSARAKVGKDSANFVNWQSPFLEIDDVLDVLPEWFYYSNGQAVDYTVDHVQRSRQPHLAIDPADDLQRILFYAREGVELRLRSDSDSVAAEAEARREWSERLYGAPTDLVHNSKARARKPRRRSSVDRATETLLELAEEDA